MKILQTSSSLNECVGQYINTALKKREIERGSQRKWGGEEGQSGGVQCRGRRIKRGAGACKSGNSIITVPWQ